ncbi:hypothetical protein QN277_018892 [Acacia crassicarpa]|nr:hypothetical protein QN277_018892 [Acacia crassicarpa]
MYNRINPLIKWVTPEFEQGVEEFLAYAFRAPYSQKSGQLRCPCVKCKCRPYLIMDEVKVHLYKWGFKPDYYIWTSHGETEIKHDPPMSPSVQSNDVNDEEEITSGKNKKAPTNGLRSEAQDIGSTPYSHAPINSGLHRVEVPENRRWMYNRIDPRTKWVTADFEKGVEEFLAYALQSPFSQKSGQIRCPCVKCKCRPHLILDEVKVHIYKWGFMPDYYTWSKHGAGYKYDSPISPSVRSYDVNDKEEIAGGKNKKARIDGLIRSKAQGNGFTPYSHANFNNLGLHPDFEQELRTKILENENLIKELRQENQDLRQVNVNILSRLMAIEHKLFRASNNSNAENDEAP